MRDLLAQLDTARAKLASIPIRSVLRTAIRTARSPNTWWTDPNARTVLSAILVAAAYYVGALIGFLVRFQSSPISPIWPPNVILLVALLLVPRRTWWVCLLVVCGAHMLIELPNGVPLATASGLYFTNSAEAVIGALGVRHFIGSPPWLGSLRRVTIYLVCAVVVAPVITSFADAAVVVLTRFGDTHDYWLLWRTRCVSNSMAQLTIGPALLLGLTRARVWIRGATRWRCVEAALLAAGLLVAGITIFGGPTMWEGAEESAIFYTVLPLLLWAAIRFGVDGMSVSLLGITLLATWGAVQGRGPFSASSPADGVISLQLFLIGISAPMLLLAALIQEREETAAALKESQARFRTMADHAPVLIWLSGPDTLCTFFNAAWLAFTGRTLEQERGTGWAQGVHPDDLTPCLDGYLNAFALRKPFTLEYRLRRYDGAYRWVVDEGVPIYSGNRHFEGYICSAIDITERRQAEEALRESEARFRAAFESAATGMMLVDMGGHPLKANRPLLEMLGYSEEELRVRTFADVTYADDVDDNLDLFRQAMAGEIDRYQLEKRYIHKQGHLVWGLMSAGVVRDAAGQPLYVVGQVQDITARKQAELALRESEERYRAVASNFPRGAVLLFGEDLRHLFADGQGLPELGLSKASVEGKTIWEAFPDNLAVALAPRYEAALSGEHAAFDLIYASHTYQMQILPIRYASTTAGMVVMQDVTEQRRAESLAELDRAKTAFFSNVSHELRTPLTLLLGPTADALADHEEPLPPRQRERLELIQRNGLLLHKQVNTLLDYSRIEAGRIRASYEPTDLAALTADLASSFRSAIERAGLRLVIDCHPLTALSQPTNVDRNMWEKIVLNLLSNALKFTFAGEIVVTLRPTGAGEGVELEVRDTGTGIADAELPHLFDRFYRVQGARARTYEGTGIGLAMVQELARLHGGTVHVASTVGMGSVFTVVIPTGSAHLPADHVADHIASHARSDQTPTTTVAALGAAPFVEEALRWLPDAPHEQPEPTATAHEAPPTTAPATSAPSTTSDRRDGYVPAVHEAPTRSSAANGATSGPNGTGAGHALSQASRRARILVADDNADMRAYLTRLLSERWDIVTVADGSAALAAARAQPPDLMPDLILADVMMPGLDGFALLHALRSDPSTQAIPVLLLSARAGEEATVEGLEAGADDYLVKPFAARELLARVRTHLELAWVRRKAAAHAAQLEAIFDAMTDGVFVLGVDGRMTRVNSAGRLILGEAPDEVCPQTAEQRARALDLRDGDGRRFSVKQLPTARLLRGEALAGANAMIVKLHARNGVERIVSLTGGPIQDATGQITGAVGVFRDVTELRQIEAALAEQERIFRTLVENSPDIITRFDRNLRHLYVSPAGEALTDIPAHVRVGKTYAELGVTEGPDGPWEQALRQVLATGEPRAFETQFQSPGKPSRTLHVRYIPEFAADGSVESVLGITSDITELKQAEARVAEQASQLEAIFEAHADGVGVYDIQGQFVRANRSLQQLYGFDAEVEFTDLPLAERAQRLLIYDEQGQRLSAEQWPHWRVLRGESLAGASALETRVQTLDGREVWVSTTGASIRGPDGQCTGVVLITRDVTARRQLEQQAVQRASEVTAVFEAIAEGISMYDAQGRIVQSNHAFQEMLGLSADPDYLIRPYPKRVAHLNARTRNGQPVPYEQMLLTRALKGEVIYADHAPDTIITTPDGREITLSRSAVPMKDAQGRVLGAVIVHRDVTMRRLLERQVAEQASQLEAIFEAMTDGVFVWDLHGNIVRRNSAAEHILGRSGHDGFFAHSLEERARLLRLRDEQGRAFAPNVLPLRRLVRGQVLTGPKAIGMRVQTGEGHERHLSLAGGPLRDATGHMIGAVGVFRDVTALKQAEEALRQSEERFSKAFHASPVSMTITSRATGRFLDANTATFQLLGYRRDEMLGKTTPELGIVDPTQLHELNDLLGQDPSARDVLVRARTKSGARRFCVMSTESIWLGSEECIITIAHDVTQRTRAEEALRAAKAAAEAAREKEQERRREAERREQIAGSLREVLTILNSTRSLTLMLDYIARQAGHLLGSDAVAICTIDTATDMIGEAATDTATDAAASARGRLVVQAADRLPPSHQSNGTGERSSAIGHVALGKAMAERRPVAVYGVALTPAASAGMVDGTSAGRREAARRDGRDGGDRAGNDGQAETGAEALPEEALPEEALPEYVAVCTEPLSAPYRALLAVPIIIGQDEVYGGILLLYTEPHRFSADEVALALAYSDQVALAIANARLQEHIERAAIEAERNRLARELHDTVTQEIFSASLMAEAIPRIWEHHRDEAAQSLQQLHQITRSALAALRALLLELRPTVLEQKPLAELLRQLGDAMTNRSGVPISLTIADDCPPIPSTVKVALYRIAQEALMNAAKHANAHHIVLHLRCARDKEAISLEIRDDGHGFAIGTVPAGHYGLGMMRERAQAAGATLRIRSRPGQGTRIVIRWQGHTHQEDATSGRERPEREEQTDGRPHTRTRAHAGGDR